ncbi:MAG: hypothetical protein ACOCUS_03970 [Polyangiales bacterium]
MLASGVLGCGGGGGDGDTIRLAMEPVHADPHDEFDGVCQSYTLDNEEPIWVQAVRQKNEGSWHHSNWFFVPQDMFPGPDGTWDCTDRGFDEVTAAVAGGVFVAQSTQVREEEQRFVDGAAFRIPPHSKIVGDIHILHLSDEPTDTQMSFEIDPIPEEEVRTELHPMGFFNRAITIPPRTESQQAMECTFDEPQDFRFYYALPHYHDLATGARIEVVGGEHDGETLFETHASVGEPWGETYDPPFSLDGATGIRFRCGYDNPRDEQVVWGIGDQEMCVFLAYTDSELSWGGFASSGTNEMLGVEDGTAMHEAPCDLQGFPPNN